MPDLSDRELQLLQLASDGLTDEAIAQQLGISVPTIRGYWLRIRTKLGGTGRAQLVGQWVQRRSHEEGAVVAQDHQDNLDTAQDDFEAMLAQERVETDHVLGLLDETSRAKIAKLRANTDSLMEGRRKEGNSSNGSEDTDSDNPQGNKSK